MNRITLTLATVLSLAFNQVTAQDFNKGLEAAQAGDFATALKEWKPLAEQGNEKAQNILGAMYYEGIGVPQDYTEAAKWYRLAAEQGGVDAQYLLGYMYRHGMGVLKSSTEAVKWYRLAAEQDNAQAQNNLGHMYELGEGVLQDNLTAHMWYNISSTNGQERAGGWSDKVAALMTPSEITEATTMAKECMNSNYKKCGY